MATIDVYDTRREQIAQVDVNDTIFDAPIKEHLFYDVIRMQMANRRGGTVSTKTRSEVRGGGRKPWRQKGTGRARAGTIRSPLWRGGGIVFGPKPRDFSISVPKKVRRSALRTALTLKKKNEKLLILDKIELPEAKTKTFVELLNTLGTKSVLIIAEENHNLELSSRNVPFAKVLSPEGLNLYDVLFYDSLVITQTCLEKIQRRLAS